MGIYSNSYVGQPSDYGHDETLESIMEDESVVPCKSDDLVEAGLDYIQTIQENYNSIFIHIGQAELQALEESGQQMVYTEGVLSSIWNTIKNFLKKIWEKIKSLFKRFIMIIDSYTKNDKDFLNKYRKELGRVTNLTDFEFKGYKFTINDENIKKAINKCTLTSHISASKAGLNIIGATPDEIDKKMESFEDDMEKVRGTLIEVFKGNGGTYTMEEFKKELNMIFRNGEDQKQSLDNKDINVHQIITELSTSSEIRKTLNKIFNENKKAIDNDDKDLNRLQKQWTNDLPLKDADTEEEDRMKVTRSGRARQTEEDYYNQNKNTLYNDGTRNVTVQQHVDGYKSTHQNDKRPDYLIFKDEIDKYHGGQFFKVRASTRTKTYGKTKKGELSERYGKGLSLALKTTQASKNNLITIDTCVMNALKDRSRQNKAIAIKMVYHKPKNEEAYNESYTGSYTGDNFLANIQLK